MFAENNRMCSSIAKPFAHRHPHHESCHCVTFKSKKSFKVNPWQKNICRYRGNIQRISGTFATMANMMHMQVTMLRVSITRQMDGYT